MSKILMAFTNQYVLFTVLLLCLRTIYSLDNGLALTPPMGWSVSQRLKCKIDCDDDPYNCINEKLFMEMADRLVMDGYRDSGYNYVIIDDCWMASSRAKNGTLLADEARFPHGIKFLADYMHEYGLRLGIYQDYAIKTCMGYPGIDEYVKLDADTFAEWGVDMVKLDGCNSHSFDLHHGYVSMSESLRKKPMLLACSWPYYLIRNEIEPDYKSLSTYCNMWRSFKDIADSWHTVQSVIDFFGDNQEVWSSYVGPGKWNDPDVLIIGNAGLTLKQARLQMAIWCILPAPLLMSHDLRNINQTYKQVILNSKAIAVNQDSLGKQGKRIYQEKDFEIWKKPILPQNKKGETSFALLFINKSKRFQQKSLILKDIGLTSEVGYATHSIFTDRYHAQMKASDTAGLKIAANDVLFMTFKLIKY